MGPRRRATLAPHLSLPPDADAEPEVTCSFHLVLMRAALLALGAPLEVTSLEAFPEGHPCVALLQAPTHATSRADGADIHRLQPSPHLSYTRH
jgi:hypothetical protein